MSGITDFSIKKAETLEEVMSILPKGRIMPRKRREFLDKLLVSETIARAEKGSLFKLRKLNSSELPDASALEAMKASVNHDSLICHFIPSESELQEIHSHGLGLREGHSDVKSIAHMTMSYRVAQKYDVTYPHYKEDREMPVSYTDELEILNGCLRHNLGKYFSE